MQEETAESVEEAAMEERQEAVDEEEAGDDGDEIVSQSMYQGGGKMEATQAEFCDVRCDRGGSHVQRKGATDKKDG